MRRDALGNYGFGNREQTTHQGVERVKFLRRTLTRHVASMIAPLLVATTTVVGAQSQPPSPRARISQRRQQQKQPQTAQQQAAPDIRGTDQSPINVKVQPTTKTPEETAKEKREEEDRATQERWTIGLGLLTAGILALQTYVFGMQARRLRETVEKMDEIAKDDTRNMIKAITESARAATAMENVASAMQATALASGESAFAAKQTLRMTQRAYLHVVGVHIRNWGNPNKPVELVVDIKNNGHLSATVTNWAGFCVVGQPLPQVRQDADLVWFTNNSSVPPDHPASLIAPLRVQWAHQEWSDLQQGRVEFAVYGVIQYDTGFAEISGETGFGYEYDSHLPMTNYADKFTSTVIAGYNYVK